MDRIALSQMDTSGHCFEAQKNRERFAPKLLNPTYGSYYTRPNLTHHRHSASEQVVTIITGVANRS